MREPLSIDVNTASADELVSIGGIGPALAQRLVQHRQEKGPFSALEELLRVPGIGPALLDRIRSHITLAPPAGAPLSEPPPPSEPMPEIAASRLTPIESPEADQADKTSEQPEEEEVAMAEDQVTREPTPEDEIPAQETEAADLADVDLTPDLEAAEPPDSESPGEEMEELYQEEIETLSEETASELDDLELPEPSPEPEKAAPESETSAEAGPAEPLLDVPQRETEVALEQAEEIEATEEEAALEQAEEIEATEEEVDEDEELEAETVAAVSDADADGGRSFWSGFLLVAAGALVGALVMLLVLLAYSGTLSYASRSQVDALSRNMDTIYQNSEVAWERLDRLSAENADLVAKVDRLMLLSGRVSELEQGMGELRADMGSIEDGMTSLESDLASLRETYDGRLGEIDATVAAQGDLLDRLEANLGEVREAMDDMTARLGRYDDFFGALRDLLIDLQGPPAEGAAEVVQGE